MDSSLSPLSKLPDGEADLALLEPSLLTGDVVGTGGSGG